MSRCIGNYDVRRFKRTDWDPFSWASPIATPNQIGAGIGCQKEPPEKTTGEFRVRGTTAGPVGAGDLSDLIFQTQQVSRVGT